MRCDARKGSAVLAAGRLGLALPAAAGALAPGVGASFASGDPLVTDAKVKFKARASREQDRQGQQDDQSEQEHLCEQECRRASLSAWVRKPYYGDLRRGRRARDDSRRERVPPAPAPNLCWYWANPATRAAIGIIATRIAAGVVRMHKARARLRMHAGLFRVSSRLRLDGLDHRDGTRGRHDAVEPEPDEANSSANSASVRSFPPTVITSISMSSILAGVGPGSSLTTISQTSTRPSLRQFLTHQA